MELKHHVSALKLKSFGYYNNVINKFKLAQKEENLASKEGRS